MSAPLPKALRVRFQRYVEEGLSGRAAALRLKLSPATGARRARAIRTRGHWAPAPQGRPKGRGKLAPYQVFFEELVAQDPDITLFELRDALAAAEGVAVHHSTLSGLLSRLGFTYKKVAGGHRAPSYQGKAGAPRMADALHAYHAGTARTPCLH
jgi:transposase